MVKRRNGFQGPFSEDQVVSWVVYPLLVAAYFIIVVLALPHVYYQVHLLWMECFLTIVFLVAYYAVETIDAAEYEDKVNIPVICFPAATKKKRYCAQCAKSVVGLDHHCTWLNTCIGIQNYVPFISLVTIGFFQMALQTIVGSLLLSPVIHDDDHKKWTTDRLGEEYAYYILIGAFVLGSVTMLISFAILLSFHLYLLLWVRVGTYEWMMGGRVEYSGNNSPSTVEDKVEKETQKKRERFEAARQAALKDATTADIENQQQRGGRKKRSEVDPAVPIVPGRSRGYDRLTVFPTGDKEMEIISAEVSKEHIEPASGTVTISNGGAGSPVFSADQAEQL